MITLLILLKKKRPTTYNKAYLATVLRTSAKIPLRGTSDTLETLSEIALRPKAQKLKLCGRNRVKTHQPKTWTQQDAEHYVKTMEKASKYLYEP